MALLAGASLVRVVFHLRAGLSFYDPWRHQLLHENVRAGRGFVLYAGEPYAYYHPAWYVFASWFPHGVSPTWIATALSAAAVPLLFLLVRAGWPEAGREGALAAGVLFAASGPVVNFTVHAGPDAFALALALLALVAVARLPGVGAAALGGALLGLAVAARTHFLLLAILMVPSVRTAPRRVAAVAGLALPLTHAWWRAHAILRDHAFVFTWDGLAVRSDGFGPLSTLVMQMHPEIRLALGRLHQSILPLPEWILSLDGDVAWGPLLFMLAGTAAVLATRHRAILASAAAGYAGLYLLDASGTGRFFRMDLPLFVPMAVAAGLLFARAWRTGCRRARALATAAATVPVLVVAPWFSTRPLATAEQFTPPRDFLSEPRYMVNSGSFLPDALMARYPDRQFIGMPLDPLDMPAFRAAYPEYRVVLFQEWSFQDEVIEDLMRSGYAPTRKTEAPNGHKYVVLEPAGGQ